MSDLRRFFVPPEHSHFLFGPRGTGKTTWLENAYPDALYLDLLEADRFRELSAQPERLEGLVLADSGVKVVVIDEVQRVPELLHTVHSLIERKLGIIFVLTGSSARKLRRGGVDLLGGRAYLCSLHPFMAAELPSFDLDRALEIGLVPLIVTDSDPEAALRAYVGLYLKEEVQAEGLTRNIGQFSRFLEAATFSHGAVLNSSQIARECQVERKTVVSYLEILEDPAALLPPAGLHPSREAGDHRPPEALFLRRRSLPLAAAERAARPPRRDRRRRARRPGRPAFARLDRLSPEGRAALFWQTRGGAEVDFVLYGQDLFQAIEVKNTSRIRPQDLRGLRSFGEDYPEAGLTLLYRGKDRLLLDGVLCLPAQDFLKKLKPGDDLPIAR